MKVETLRLRNFRNVEEAEFQPASTVNFLVGANGQGKTSFIEAIGFLATLRSFKDSKPFSLVRWDTRNSEVSATVIPDEGEEHWKAHLRVVFQVEDTEQQKVKKSVFVNEKSIRNSTQYLSQKFGSYELGFHAIIFNPSDHDLVRGTPSLRRNYLDHVLAAEDVGYLKVLKKYQRVLEQRNALLKSLMKAESSYSVDHWLGFTEPLCDLGCELASKRLHWLRKLQPYLNQTLKKIAPNQPDLTVTYQSSWIPDGLLSSGEIPSQEELEKAFWAKVSTYQAVERKLGYSLVGPHRDDWAFYYGLQPLKGQGSQGEVRAALLALKLTELHLFRQATGHRPLFLLDDFSSELDRERRLFLLEFLMQTDLQTFVTTTESLGSHGKQFVVRNGSIMEEKTEDKSASWKEKEVKEHKAHE